MHARTKILSFMAGLRSSSYRCWIGACFVCVRQSILVLRGARALMSGELNIQAVISGILMGLIYALVAAGRTLVCSVSDNLDLAGGGFLMLAMFTTFWFW